MKVIILAGILWVGLVGWTKADEAGRSIITVIHIDAMPPFTQGAATLLDSFRRDSIKEAGEKQFQVLLETEHTNHFTLVETWSDEKAYEAHNDAPHTRKFREEIQPMLGLPFDERTHYER